MPLFDFICLDCGHPFEALVRPQDAEPPRCPQCQSVELEKQLANFAVQYEGKTRAAADKVNAQRAATARQENVALHHETEAHRREDH